MELYTPTIACCNGTSWIKMGFPVDPSASVSLRVFHVSMKPSFVATQTELGSVSFFRIRVGLSFSISVVQKNNFATTPTFRLLNVERLDCATAAHVWQQVTDQVWVSQSVHGIR